MLKILSWIFSILTKKMSKRQRITYIKLILVLMEINILFIIQLMSIINLRKLQMVHFTE